MMEISKDEYIVLLTSLQDRQQQAQATIMAHVVQQFTDILNRMNEPQMEAAPTDEQLVAQKAERDQNRRDAFACNAMQGILAANFDAGNVDAATDNEAVARHAYDIADAMLAARVK